MKKTLKQFITVTGIATMLLVGFSVASAEWNPPVRTTGTGVVVSPTADNAKPVDASINTEMFDQIKKGGITISSVLKSFVSPLSFFKKTLLPGSDTSVYIGGASFADPSFTSSFPGNRSVPLTIDLTGRANETGAIKFKTNAQCPQTTKIINSKAQAFQFWNSKEGVNADILAKGIRLDGGNPAPGKILIAVDNNGRAVWATPKLAANGRDITFERDSDSPVGVCGVPPAEPSCPTGQNWNGTQCICSNTGNVPLSLPTGNGSVATKKINTQVCTTITGVAGGTTCEDSSADPLIPPYALLKQGRSSNGGPGNACVIINTVPPFDACPAADDGDIIPGNATITDYNTGTVYPLGTSGQAGKWQIVSSLGDSCRFSEDNISNPGAPSGSTTSRSTLYTIQSNP